MTPNQAQRKSGRTARRESATQTLQTTPSGVAVLSIGMALLGLGLLRSSAPLLLPAVLILATWIGSRRLALRHLSAARVSRPLPARVRAGRSFAVEACITGLPRHRESDPVFQDPLANSGLSDGNQNRRITVPSSGSSLTLAYPARCPKRGHLRPTRWVLRSSWPLGWFETRREDFFAETAAAARDTLVLPAPLLPPDLLRHLDASQRSAAISAGNPDPVAEFRLLRAFRPGDSIRAIHWPSSLRNHDLLVREPDPPQPLPSRYGILLHSYRPAGELHTPESFETVVRVATGLLLRFANRQTPVVWTRAPQQPRLLRTAHDFDAALDELAVARPHPLPRLSDLTTDTAARAAFAACESVFLLGDSPRRHWEQELRPLVPRAVCIDAAFLSFPPQLRTHRRSAPSPQRAHVHRPLSHEV